MRKFNVILGIFLILTGVLFLINDWHKTLSVIFIAGGIFSVISDLLFSTDEPNDERRKAIKIKGGHISYLFSIINIFLIVLLFENGMIKDPLNGFIFILAGNILIFPLTIVYYNKKL